jgi:hypothetical protein
MVLPSFLTYLNARFCRTSTYPALTNRLCLPFLAFSVELGAKKNLSRNLMATWSDFVKQNKDSFGMFYTFVIPSRNPRHSIRRNRVAIGDNRPPAANVRRRRRIPSDVPPAFEPARSSWLTAPGRPVDVTKDDALPDAGKRRSKDSTCQSQRKIIRLVLLDCPQ